MSISRETISSLAHKGSNWGLGGHLSVVGVPRQDWRAIDQGFKLRL